MVSTNCIENVWLCLAFSGEVYAIMSVALVYLYDLMLQGCCRAVAGLLQELQWCIQYKRLSNIFKGDLSAFFWTWTFFYAARYLS